MKSLKVSLFILATGAIVVTPLLNGCAPLIFSSAVAVGSTTVSSAVDRRSTGAQVNDGILETRVNAEINQALGKNAQTHITVTAYNGWVLLTGEVSTAEEKQTAVKTAQASLDVKCVIDEIAVMEPAGVGQRVGDSTLATKVRTNIIANKKISINQMKVTVDRGIVYLTGLLTPEENREACISAAKTGGVIKVVSHVEILSAERIAQMQAEEEARKIRQAQ